MEKTSRRWTHSFFFLSKIRSKFNRDNAKKDRAGLIGCGGIFQNFDGIWMKG